MLTKEQKEILSTRKEYYNDNDILQMNSSVKNAKNSSLPFLSKKASVLMHMLLANDIKKDFRFSLDSLSNEYRNSIKTEKESNAKVKNYQFRKSFKTSEIFDVATLKQTIQYIYIVNKRLFEYERNEKGHYLIHEIPYREKLLRIKK